MQFSLFLFFFLLLRQKVSGDVFLVFWLYCEACGTLVPQPGIEPGPLAATGRSPNHWIIGEIPCLYFTILEQRIYLCLSHPSRSTFQFQLYWCFCCFICQSISPSFSFFSTFYLLIGHVFGISAFCFSSFCL